METIAQITARMQARELQRQEIKHSMRALERELQRLADSGELEGADVLDADYQRMIARDMLEDMQDEDAADRAHIRALSTASRIVAQTRRFHGAGVRL